MAELIVEVEQGKLKGRIDYDYHGGRFFSFLGIPYAKAPVGELRFKAPQPPEPWTDIRCATKDGPECPSRHTYLAYYVGNEDNCLHLNVFTKELPKQNSSKKPVMVWFYGGGFIQGSNTTESYGPQYLMTQDIVLVCVNYRTGMLGFLSLKDPTLEVPGNAGLKDMVMGLKWIQKNIDKFGGDCNNVTIFGESAGGASVHYLTLSQQTKGLFHKGILQSGCALNHWTLGRNNVEEVIKVFGYKDKDEKSVLQKLRKESTRNIVNAQHKIPDNFSASVCRPWTPVVEPPSEDAFLTEKPIDIIRAGRNHQIPIIVGYNTKEGIMFGLLRKVNSSTNLSQDLEDDIPYELNLKMGSEESKEVANKIKTHYFQNDDISEDNIDKFYTMKGDFCFVHGIQRTIRIQSETFVQPIYVYRMSVESGLNFFKRACESKYFYIMIGLAYMGSSRYLPLLRNLLHRIATNLPAKRIDGVSHADDLFYLFKVFIVPKITPGSLEDKYIQRFVKLWTNFAKSGNPTPEVDELLNNVTWKPIERGKIEMIDIGYELKMIDNVDEERLKLLDDLYKTYEK